jgi:hypothetical protein
MEPTGTLTALESCSLASEFFGYNFASLFRKMTKEIKDMQRIEISDENAALALIKKFGAYPCQAYLEIEPDKKDMCFNYYPDYCLAQAIEKVIEEKLK